MKKLLFKNSPVDRINLDELFKRFTTTWQPHLLGELNRQQVKLMKFIGLFEWQQHESADVLYMAFFGKAVVQLRKRNIELLQGEFVVIPRKTRYRLVAPELVYLVILEPKGTTHTHETGILQT